MVKSLDGIKKLSPDDIKKYRKIVLNYIGEKDSTEVSEQEVSSSRMVDGVNLNKASRFSAKNKIGSASPVIRPIEPAPAALSGASEESVKSREREEERMGEAIRRQAEERQKIKDEDRRYQLDRKQAERAKREQAEKLRQEKIRLEKERVARGRAKEQEIKRAAEIKIWEEKIKLEEQEEEKQRRVRESLEREKTKRAEEINRIKWEREIKNQAIREKKKIKRQKAWKRIKKNLKFKLRILLLRIKQNIIYIVSFLAVSLAIIYIVFCLAVLRLNNGFIGWAANYLPVPAAITSQGIVSYSDYRKIENKDYLAINLAEKKSFLAEWVILRDLRNKYRLPSAAHYNDLAIKFILDKDFNQVGLSRINKISELIKGGSEFESLGRYADEYSDGAYYDHKSLAEKFGSKGLDLAVGQASQIMASVNGYYIVERIDDKNGQLGLKYLFIKPLTLDQYVAQAIKNINVFILAN